MSIGAHRGGKIVNLHAGHLNPVSRHILRNIANVFKSWSSPGQIVLNSDVLRWAGQPRVAEVRAGQGSSGAISGEFSTGRHYDH
jgi:hypothetical protein